MKKLPLFSKPVLSALLVVGLISSALIACSRQQETSETYLQQNGGVVATAGAADIPFYAGRSLQSWNIFFKNHEGDQVLSGAYAALPDGSVVVKTTDKDVQKDALTFSWQSVPFASLRWEGGPPLNISEHVKQGGTLSFDLNIARFDNAGLDITLNCGPECERKVSLTEFALNNQGKGWKNVSIPLACFNREGDDFSRVLLPFTLGAGGEGELSLANIIFHRQAQGNITCPDYKTVSVTPAPLNEYWAKSWWMPRHLAVLDRVKQGKVDLLMIGDSITQGWEKEGSTIWERFYARRNAVNLGFSGDRTENVLWRLQNGEVDGIEPKVAILMIGTNNTGHRHEAPETTAKGIRTILDELRSRLPETRILLLGIFPREEKPEAMMRQVNRNINSVIQHYADNQHIFYLDVGSVFLTEEQILSRDIMPDLLHLNEEGYRRWAEAMEPELERLLD